MTPVLALARLVPIWAWALVAALACGAWQRHSARAADAALAEQRAEQAQQRERQLASYVEAWTLAARKQQEIADDARKTAARNAAAARAAAAAAGGLRDDLAAALADAAAADAAAGQCAATAAAARVSADVLGRAVERAGILARYADEAAAAGGACERAYRALTP